MRRTLFLCAGSAFAALILAPAANAQNIGFNNLNGANGDSFFATSENGFYVQSWDSVWFQAQNYGNPVPDIYTNNTYTLNTIVIGENTNTINAKGNGLTGIFHFGSFDYSSNNGASFFQVRGFLNGSLVYSQIGDLQASFDPFGFNTIHSTDTNAWIDTLYITVGQSAGMLPAANGDLPTSINLDNINLNPTPEPATMALMGLGLTGLIAKRRAKKA